jgi:sugar (pentulose or hexulose) kinase
VLRAVAKSEPRDAPPGGICFSGAMHSLLPIADDAGTPLSNAMTWADARVTAVYRSLIADTDVHALYRRTGCPLQWVREKLYPELVGAAGFEQLASDAESVAPGAEGVFLLPYFAGERSPHWTPEDKGMLHGLDAAQPHAYCAGGDGRGGQLPRRCAALGETLENLKESFL